MILPDVNILVYAHRQDAPDHDPYRAWLAELLEGPTSFGVSDLVLSGFIRVVTHRRVFKTPSPMAVAIGFAHGLRDHPNAVPISPGPRHWEIFMDFCHKGGVAGNLVPDAYLAALAVESGSEWITTDRDYARFDGLRWRHPLNN